MSNNTGAEAALSEISDTRGGSVLSALVPQEQDYRFPRSRAFVETTPDIASTFNVRLVWHKGKAPVVLLETTALRPVAQVTMGGQSFPVFLNQQSRKRRNSVLLAGKRKTAKSARCALRFVALIEGREDRLAWTWRIGATPAARALADAARAADPALPPDEITLCLPFAPGKARVLTQPGVTAGLAVWINDLVITFYATPAVGVLPGFATTPELIADARAVRLVLRGAGLCPPDSSSAAQTVTLGWETWVAPARTEAEARAALLRHIAEGADRSQVETPIIPDLLAGITARGEAALMREDAVGKRGMDRLAFLGATADTHVAGEGVDAALAAVALLGRFYQSGDDAVRRRARLISRGVCDFQMSTEQSPHWGAIWDTQTQGSGKKYTDISGEGTFAVATTARAARGLHIAHAHFGTEVLQRSALAAAQWLMLKMDREGFIVAERFHEDGPPVDEMASPWVMAEAIIPFVATFRANQNEIFLKAAMRIINAIKTGLAQWTLPLDRASTTHLADAIEGILLASREYENPDFVALAKQLGVALRARRQNDGSFIDGPDVFPLSPLVPSLSGARAALALARVDDDPLWVLMALRALRAASAQADGQAVNLADETAFCALPTSLLLQVAARAKNCLADHDNLTVTRGWQTFSPDPATREYVQVFCPETGESVDHLTLVCPNSLQVLVMVLAPPTLTHVAITKNHKSPFVKNLLTGDYEKAAELVPLGNGAEARMGVFLADT